MNAPFKNFLFLLTATLVLSGSASAQIILQPGGRIVRVPRTNQPPASMPEDAGLNEGGVVVMDNFAAQDALAQADLLVNAKEWPGAAAAYQRAIDQFGQYLLTVTKYQRRTVADVLQERILHWPAEGLAAYVRYSEPLASKALAEAKKSGNLADLGLIGTRFFATPSGAAALELAADRLADEGDPGAGAAMLTRLQSHPKIKLPTVLARLAMWDSWSGRPAAARQAVQKLQDLISPKDPLLVRALDALQQPLPERKDAPDYPVYGGDETRTRTASTSSRADVVIWSRSYRKIPQSVRNDDKEGWKQAQAQGLLLNSLPVVSGGLIFVQDQTALSAFSLNSGSLVWKARLSSAEWDEEAGNRGPFNPYVNLRIYSPTVAEGRVYACLGQESVIPAWVMQRRSQMSGELTCRDARTGSEIWTFPASRGGAVPEAFQGMCFDSSPLVLQGRLYALARRNQGSGNEDVHLFCLNAATGQLHWSVFLSSAPVIRYATLLQSYLAADAGRILAVTNAGSIAGVDALTGRIAWLNLYPRPQPDAYLNAWAYTRRMCGWLSNPPFVDQGRLLAMPDDSNELYLFDTGDGRELAHIGMAKLGGGRVQELLGVLDSRLYGISEGEGDVPADLRGPPDSRENRARRVFAFDLDKQELAWQAPLASPAFGRACLTRRGIFVPTYTQLWFYPLSGDSPLALPTPRPPEEMGNVVALPEQVLVTGCSVLTSYARWEDVRERLQNAVQANPAKPGPRLDLAEVALRSGGENLAFGLEMLDRGVDLAGGWARMQPPDFQKRVFRSCLALAADALQTKRPDTAEKLYERAYRCPPDVPSRIEMLRAFSDFLEAGNRTAEAIAKLQEILADPALRKEMVPRVAEKNEEDNAPGECQAGRLARGKIEKLVRRHGPSVYARFEAQARQKFQAALALPGKERPEKLNEIIALYPQASVISQALLAKAQSAIATGAHEQAYYTLLSLWNNHREETDLALVLRLLAEEAAAWGRPRLAAEWLAKGQSMFRSSPLDLGHGETTTFEKLAQKLNPGGSLPVEAALPDLPANLPFKYTVRIKNPAVLEPAYTPPGARSDLLVLGANTSRKDELLRRRVELKEAFATPNVPVLFVLKAADGRLAFAPPLLPQPAVRLIAALPDRLLVQTQLAVVAVSTETGKVLWTYGETGEPPDTDPENINALQTTILAGRQIIGIRGVRASGKGEIFSIQAQDGVPVWRYPLLNLPEEEVSFSGDKYLAYRINTPESQRLVVINLDQGEEILRLTLGKLGEFVSCGFSPSGKLIVQTEQKLAAYDPETGENLWGPLEAFATGIMGNHVPAAFGPDGFYVESGARLVKHGYENGEKIWSVGIVSSQDPRLLQDAALLSPRLFIEGDSVYLAGPKQADAIQARTGKIWNGRVPGAADFIASRNTARFLVSLNEKSAGRREARPKPELEKAYTLFFYNKQAQMRCDAIMELGAFAQFGSFFVRDGAAGIVTPNQITVYTASEPPAKEINLGE